MVIGGKLHTTNVATTLTTLGKAQLNPGLARRIEFVLCPPHSCQRRKGIEGGHGMATELLAPARAQYFGLSCNFCKDETQL